MRLQRCPIASGRHRPCMCRPMGPVGSARMAPMLGPLWRRMATSGDDIEGTAGCHARRVGASTAVCASCNGTTVLAPWASLDCRHATPPAPAATWQGPGSGRDKMCMIVPLGATFRAKPGCVVTTFWPVELDPLGRSLPAEVQMNGFWVVWDGPHQV
jgi:hypothetical protein